jgi:light-regulated signal transduction histidine kinase (bacteriophytochrome)
VWANLLPNAVTFTGPRASALITVDGALEGNDSLYTIDDNGVGFTMEYTATLFAVFQRLHRRDEFEGTGEGLGIVHRIVQRHGGRGRGEGRVDEGATFSFWLPRHEAHRYVVKPVDFEDFAEAVTTPGLYRLLLNKPLQ